MLYVIFSDIHGNLAKFAQMHEMLENMPGRKRLVSLGDITGGSYTAVKELYYELRYNGYTTVKGNCDDGFDFADGPITVDDLFIACHGSPYADNDYIRNVADAQRVFPYIISEKKHILFYGHTHRHRLWTLDRMSNKVTSLDDIPVNQKIKLDREKYYLCNPGTLGRPKAATPFCSFVLFDSAEFSLEWKRV